MAKKQKDLEVNVSEVLDYLRITGKFAPALREVIERKIVVERAKEKGLRVTPQQLQKAADAFRVTKGLNKAKDTEKWLKSLGITADTLEEFLETNLLINKFKDHLEKKTAKTKYLSKPVVKNSIRNMIYRDWMSKETK